MDGLNKISADNYDLFSLEDSATDEIEAALKAEAETAAGDTVQKDAAADSAQLPPDMPAADQSAGTHVALSSEKPAKKTKGKTTIISPDPIHNAAHAVENLKAEDARKEVKRLIDGTEFDLFKLGGVLAQVHTKEFWSEYGFQDFRTYLEQEHGLNYRKAMYMISIYFGVIEHELVWSDIESLGWTKLKVLLNPSASSVVTSANIQMWLDKAKEMTVLQLESAIKGALAGPESNATEQDPGKTVTTLTFKLHEDQKATVREALEKAKEAAGTEFDTVALEMMALEYMNKPTAILSATEAPTGDLGSLMKSVGWEEVLKQFEKVWPNIELTVDIPHAD